jgi:hypothetical protein
MALATFTLNSNVYLTSIRDLKLQTDNLIFAILIQVQTERMIHAVFILFSILWKKKGALWHIAEYVPLLQMPELSRQKRRTLLGNGSVNTFMRQRIHILQKNCRTKTPWSESASELYRPSDRRLSVKLTPTFSDRRCRAVGVTIYRAVFSGF